MAITITPLAEAGVAVLPPDIVWLTPDGRPAGLGAPGVSGDFALSTAAADGPAGGLVARNPLRTAVLLLLFTDGRASAGQITWTENGDRRGWVGDGFDVDQAAGERPLGSLLWLYRRRELTARTAIEVQAEGTRALQPLLAQRAVARIDVKASADEPAGSIRLSVALYGRDGREMYADRFDLLWKSADGL